MIRTFLIGIILGAVAAAGALYAFPAVDQEREPSLVSVAPNGGNIEMFHVNVPMDRVLVGAPSEAGAVPDGLEWPDDASLVGVRTEMFKIRNARDSVVGIAARTTATRGDEDIIDWVLHLPARGSVFASMESNLREGGIRDGAIRSGSREFSSLGGSLTERWIADTSGDEDAPQGRIELQAIYRGQPERLADEQEAVE
ncbi:MAG: hypothetical protein KJP08_08885 [Gammaproteobacteria bacterium]|nr:hypothetical protein [Gammaproteobacteria bacterium]NNF49327.1 hypothetical protein [Woeseiaceae bacterium]MBT8094912.1 hypothetical protein [Gammaproteobacteria bacterium]MBT8104520.1 hypothetical protein [Gammaproteobacteria bacterium]NNK24534.1 hypothetical protein [Woeseiaceae bacterium]